VGATLPCPVCESSSARPFLSVRDGELRREYRRCGHCRATFLRPDQRPDRDAERREYDLHRNRIEDPGYRRFLARLTEPLRARLPEHASGLDFGCGPAPALAAMLEEHGFSVALWDPFYRPDREALRRRWGFITCTEVIEHLHSPAAVFRAFDRLLQPGGVLGLMTCFQTDDARFAGWHYRRDPTHVVFYREYTLRTLAESLGWKVEFPARDVALLHKP